MQTNIVDELLAKAVAQKQPALSEYDSKLVLAAYGVPVSTEQLATDASDAVQYAQQIQYPVAVKACSPDLLHKTERGLIRLNLDSRAALEAAISEIGDALEDTSIDGYLVQKMVPGNREIIVGALRDATFGPSVMLGLGGILVEAVGDVSFRLAPLEERDALEMILELRAQRIFEAFRGEPPVDRAALSAILIAVGNMLIDYPRISQIDINPLIMQDGQPVAVDALVTLAEQGVLAD